MASRSRSTLAVLLACAALAPTAQAMPLDAGRDLPPPAASIAEEAASTPVPSPAVQAVPAPGGFDWLSAAAGAAAAAAIVLLSWATFGVRPRRRQRLIT